MKIDESSPKSVSSVEYPGNDKTMRFGEDGMSERERARILYY